MRSKEDADLSIVRFLNNLRFILLSFGRGLFLFLGGIGLFGEEVDDKQEDA